MQKRRFEISEVSNRCKLKQISENTPGFTNLFSSELLKSLDAIWLDTDVVVFSDDLERHKDYIFGNESDSTVNGSVLGIPVVTKALDKLSNERKKYSKNKIICGGLNPKMFTRTISKNRLLEQAWPISEFYEIHATEIWRLYSANDGSELWERLRDKKIVHLWNEASKLLPFKFSYFSPQEGSFLYKVDVEFWVEGLAQNSYE